MTKKERARAIVEELKALYPEGVCSLNYPKPYELLFAVHLPTPVFSAANARWSARMALSA